MAPENPYAPTNTAAQNLQASHSRWQLALLAFALLLLGLGIYLYWTQEPVTIYTPYSDWSISFSEAGPGVRVGLLRVIAMNACLLLGCALLLISLAAILRRSSKQSRGKTQDDTLRSP